MLNWKKIGRRTLRVLGVIFILLLIGAIYLVKVSDIDPPKPADMSSKIKITASTLKVRLPVFFQLSISDFFYNVFIPQKSNTCYQSAHSGTQYAVQIKILSC